MDNHYQYLRNARSVFHDFAIDVEELAAKEDVTDHQVDALHHQCQGYINTYYTANNWPSAFPETIKALTANREYYNNTTRLERLRLLAKTVEKDLDHRKSIEEERQKEVEDEKQKKIDECLAEIIALRRTYEGRSMRMTHLRQQLEKCKAENDTLKNDHKIEIDGLKDDYQGQIDTIKNQPKPRIYKPHFYITLGILLTTLNFGIPYLLKSVVWKEIIWLQVAIIATVIVLYVKEVSKRIEFLVMILLTILLAVFLGK